MVDQWLLDLGISPGENWAPWLIGIGVAVLVVGTATRAVLLDYVRSLR